MTKSELRHYYIALRNSITNKDIKSDIICNKIINDYEFINSKVIA